MLTISDEVKALFSSDTVHKNFHVHFPNGETSDLNNENVISESVTFTESLCSQQYFKFGLAEASQIEFIAVNIPNVRGAYIECAIEIDCTRLGATWAANHPVDATLDWLTPQTCNYNNKLYYRVPYGRFKVDTCPRDHGAMAQRKVLAYSEIISSSTEMNRNENQKLNTFLPYENVYSPNLYLLFITLINRAELFTDPEWTNSVISADSGLNPTAETTATIYLEGDQTAYTLTVSSTYARYSATTNDLQMSDLVTIDTARDMPLEKAAVKDYIKNDMGIDWEQTLTASSMSSVDEFLNALLINRQFLPSFVYGYQRGSTLTSSAITMPIPSVSDLIYPKIGIEETNFVLEQIWFPAGSYSVRINTSPVTSHQFNYASARTLTKHRLTTPNAFSDIVMKFNSTLKSSVYYGIFGKRITSYSFANAFSVMDFVVGQLELNGWFIKSNRDGDYDFFQMSVNPSTIAVDRSDWSGFWWDETPVSSIGQVQVIFAGGEEEQVQTFVIGEGNSIYVMDKNAIIANSNMDATAIQNILDTMFAPNASVVNFTPVDLEMRALPYLESGDYIELTAEDGTTVQTYILSQTISGIQRLTASITSTNGELLEVVEE